MSCARPPGRPSRRTGRWARWAAWWPAGSPGSSGSAAPASRSPATRPPGSRRWPIAVDWLRDGELDAAIVGAVDFAGDDRASLVRGQLGGRHPDGQDSAFCLVLKRLDHARRDGDPVYALIRDIATATDGVGVIGESGAATGLAEVVRAAVGLHDRIQPAADQPARFWLQDRTESPRRTTVKVTNLGGKASTVILEEDAASEGPSPRLAPPTGMRRSGLFALEGDDDAAILERIRELDQIIREHPDESIDAMARRWWRRHPGDPRLPRGLAIVADGVESLRNHLAAAKRRASDHRDTTPRGVAFVYPGLGNDFEGMGRELGLLWPDVLHRQDRENGSLRDQLAAEVWWTGRLRARSRITGRRSSARSRSAAWSPTSCSDWGSHRTPRSATAWASPPPWSRSGPGRIATSCRAGCNPLRCSRRNSPDPARPPDGPGVSRPIGRSPGSPGSSRSRPKM